MAAKERGLQQPIVVWRDGSLLDGRNRLLACYRTNQEVVLERYEGNDPVQFSISANLRRRHLNAGQKAIVALKVRELLQPAAKERQREAAAEAATARLRDEAGRLQVSADLREAMPAPISPAQPAIAAPSVPSSPPTPAEQRKSTAQAAKAVGASPRAVEQAARVAKVAPDLLPQVQAGTMALDKAHKEAQQRQRQQVATRPQPETPKLQQDATITLLDHR